MSYTIYNSDGTILSIIADGTVDKVTTNLTLVGKNVASYGQYFNENFVTVLSNSSSTPQDKPINPLPGQLWYDIVNSQLNIFDTDLGWRNVIGAEINPNLPVNLGIGDFWFDQINKQLHIKPNASTATWIIGPAFSASIGGEGWVLPTTPVKDVNGIVQNITLLENYGTAIGLISSTPFLMSRNDSLTYFGTSTQQSVVAGLTIFKDIYFGGTMINKGLSMSVQLPSLFPQYAQYSPNPGDTVYPYDYNQLITIHNPAIQRLLTMSFPPANAHQVPFVNLVDQVGFPVGCEASVTVFTPGANIFPVMAGDDQHVRRFRIVYDHAIGQNRWDAIMVYPVPQTRDINGNVTAYYQSLSNVVPEYSPNQTNQNWINVPE